MDLSSIDDHDSGEEVDITKGSNAVSTDSGLEDYIYNSDSEFKSILQFKCIQALFVKYVMSEYSDYPLDKVVEAAINPVADRLGYRGKPQNPGISSVIAVPGGPVICADVRFIARHLMTGRRADSSEPAAADLQNDSAEPQTAEKALEDVRNSGNAVDFVIIKVEGQNDDDLAQSVLNRLKFDTMENLYGNLKISEERREKYTDICDTVIIWLIFGANETLQNMIREEEFVIKNKVVNNYQKSNNVMPGSIVETGLDTSLVRQLFVYVGDATKDNVKIRCPFLYDIDLLFGSGIPKTERIKLLRESGVIKE